MSQSYVAEMEQTALSLTCFLRFEQLIGDIQASEDLLDDRMILFGTTGSYMKQHAEFPDLLDEFDDLMEARTPWRDTTTILLNVSETFSDTD